jgi:hypothetical protein
MKTKEQILNGEAQRSEVAQVSLIRTSETSAIEPFTVCGWVGDLYFSHKLDTFEVAQLVFDFEVKRQISAI